MKRFDSYYCSARPSSELNDPLDEPLTKEQSEADEKQREEYKQRNRKAFSPENIDKIVITVLDTGTGISNKDQKKLFKMFGYL